MNEIIRDGGIKSRKLWFSVFSITIIFIGGLAAAHWAAVAAIYSTMVGGILGVVGAYLTGNIATKYVGTKAPMEVPGSKTADPQIVKADPEESK